MNAATWYNATHYCANSSRNSSRLKNRRCELTIRLPGDVGQNVVSEVQRKLTSFQGLKVTDV